MTDVKSKKKNVDKMFGRNIVVLFLEQLNLSRSKLKYNNHHDNKNQFGKAFHWEQYKLNITIVKTVVEKKNNQKTNNDNKTQRIA